MYTDGDPISIGSTLWDRKTGELIDVATVEFDADTYSVNGRERKRIEQHEHQYMPALSRNGCVLHKGDLIMGHSDERLFTITSIDLGKSHPVEVNAKNISGEPLRLKLEWCIALGYMEDVRGKAVTKGLGTMYEGYEWVVECMDYKDKYVYLSRVDPIKGKLVLAVSPMLISLGCHLASI